MFRKKIWTALFVLCMILAVLTVSAFAAEDAPELVDGYYEIYTADQLYWFAAQVNSGNTSINGKLMADIVVNRNVLRANGTYNGDGSTFRKWIPMGTDYASSYKGTFDGNGKSISGLFFNDAAVNYVGLFGYVYGGMVQNVGVVDSYLCGNSAVGGVVGWNNTGTVSACYNSGSVKGEGVFGGVVGNNKGTVTNCYNTGIVSGEYNLGGVVGLNESGTVSDCYNTGTISGTGGVAGVVGFNQSSITDCYNTGIVNGKSYVGGVAGESSGSTALSNCYNTGKINGTEFVAGVVGFNGSSITDCYNTGIVNGKSYVGGVVGHSYATINNSYNTGSITGNGSYASVGGVVGDSNNPVMNCYNTGSIIGSGVVGGIVGCAKEKVSNCYNTGTITLCSNPGAEDAIDIPVGTGGIVGYCASSNNVINCYYLSGCTESGNSHGTAMTADQFTSGEVAYLLHGNQTGQIWGQLVGAEGCPILGGEKVYGENGSYHNSCVHNWIDASCTKGATCLLCGAVGNDYPGHQWIDATCTAPKTCSVCGETEGAALGHEAYTYSYDSTNKVHTFVCPACGRSFTKESTDGKKFSFNTAAPALSDDIVMNIATTLPAGFGEHYMVVEFNGVTTTLTNYTINQSNGRYVFAFAGINPQTMGDTFHATLYAAVDGVQVSVELEYSMMKYINSQLKKTTITAELRTALSDLVMYGQANQVYEGYKTNALLNSLLESSATLTPSKFSSLSASYNRQVTSGTKNANIDLKGVSMSLGAKVVVRLTVFCADPSAYSVKVNIGELEYIYAVSDLELADGYTDRYVVEFDQLKATQFGDVITFSFLNANGKQVGRTLTYTVYTYIQKNQTAADSKLVNLLKAIYNYGESVKKL